MRADIMISTKNKDGFMKKAEQIIVIKE